MRHNAFVLLRELVRTSEAVTATSRRGTTIGEIARLLREASPAEAPVVVAFLSGELTQRQIGVGYAAISELLTGHSQAGDDAPALTVSETDAVFAEVGAAAGARRARASAASAASARASAVSRSPKASRPSGICTT